jgi:circadian clock protein KaiB
VNSEPPLDLRLFVADHAPNSVQAEANIRKICDALPQGCVIDVVDVTQEPLVALQESVNMTPTLVKVTPSPECRIVGTLSQTDDVLEALGVNPAAPD